MQDEAETLRIHLKASEEDNGRLRALRMRPETSEETRETQTDFKEDDGGEVVGGLLKIKSALESEVDESRRLVIHLEEEGALARREAAQLWEMLEEARKEKVEVENVNRALRYNQMHFAFNVKNVDAPAVVVPFLADREVVAQVI